MNDTSSLPITDEPSHVTTTTGEPAATYQPVDPERAEPPQPMNARGWAVTCLAIVALLYLMHWATEFLVPMAFGIMLAYTLNPVVKWLERIHLPRSLGTLLVLSVLLGAIAFGATTLRGEFQSIINQLPEAARKIGDQLKSSTDGTPSTIEQVQKAATELEKAATTGADKAAVEPKQEANPTRVRVSELLWVGSVGAIELVAQATMVIFLVFFLLVSGDTFKRKLVKLTGPSLSNKKITVQILDEINVSIQAYMFMLLVTNLLLALMMWGALLWIGLENPGAWAVAAGFLHIIPYFGPLIITTATGLSAFMQFQTLAPALLVAGSSLVIATFVGIFVTTWMTGKIAKMNPTAVFVGLLFWGWLWGIWGLLLGIPIMVVLKVIAAHVEEMHPIAELLSD